MVFDEYKTVGKSWNKDTIVSFEFEQKDTTGLVNMFVNLRENSAFPFSNLFLIVALEHPSKKTVIDTLEYQMADSQGELLGSGFTDTKESKLFYKERYKFNESGNYKVYIQQALRYNGKVTGVEQLDGITEVGFRIEKLQ
jgi:gliding motility-associated lipoprotein GldH